MNVLWSIYERGTQECRGQCVCCSNTFRIHSIHGVAAHAVGVGESCGGGVDQAPEWTAARRVSSRAGINGQWHLALCHTDTALSIRRVASGHTPLSRTFNTAMNKHVSHKYQINKA